jgi:hypothetical protein
MSIHAFSPISGGTKSISVTTTSGGVALNAAGSDAFQLRLSVVNAATGFGVHVKTGVSAATATTADLYVRNGESVVISKPKDHAFVAARTDAGTATLFITPGDGI